MPFNDFLDGWINTRNRVAQRDVGIIDVSDYTSTTKADQAVPGLRPPSERRPRLIAGTLDDFMTPGKPEMPVDAAVCHSIEMELDRNC